VKVSLFSWGKDMSENVWLKCGKIYNLVSQDTPPTGAITGSWLYKDSPYSTFQAVVNGTGAIGATVVIQVSNDGVNAISTVLGTITLSGTTVVSDGFSSTSSWKYVRAVISAPSGTISSISVLMGV
jgi:hypothetical protein